MVARRRLELANHKQMELELELVRRILELRLGKVGHKEGVELELTNHK